MDSIVIFLSGIGDAITALIDFVISLFQDLIYMIQLLGRFVAQIPAYFSWLPGELLALLVLIFSVVVLYKILGREG